MSEVVPSARGHPGRRYHLISAIPLGFDIEQCRTLNIPIIDYPAAPGWESSNDAVAGTPQHRCRRRIGHW